jgi:hypothetical protein
VSSVSGFCGDVRGAGTTGSTCPPEELVVSHNRPDARDLPAPPPGGFSRGAAARVIGLVRLRRAHRGPVSGTPARLATCRSSPPPWLHRAFERGGGEGYRVMTPSPGTSRPGFWDPRTSRDVQILATALAPQCTIVRYVLDERSSSGPPRFWILSHGPERLSVKARATGLEPATTGSTGRG